MKKLLYTIIAISICISATLWYGCNDKEKEAESFGSIFGMVSVAGSAEPMRGTGVELYYLNEEGTAGALLFRTTTADDGSYSFDDVKAGEYLLRVEIPGYKRTEYRVVVESGRSARADMQVIAKGEGDEETDEVYVIKAANLMVQKGDLGKGYWSTADAMCKASTLGGYNDWRLPTKDELMILYNNKELIGGFSAAKYWSSSYSHTSNSIAYYYYIDLSTVTIGSQSEYWDGCIRAVRYINPPESYVTIPAANLMVQKEDLGKGSWSTAEAMCKASILADYTDWRLPTKEELMVLYTNRNLIGGFQNTCYWSSSRYSDGKWYWYVNFENGTVDNTNVTRNTWGIRAVRDINSFPYIIIPELSLMVQKKDLPLGECSWYDARSACEQLTIGDYTDWRLPTETELVELCYRKYDIGGFKEDFYWSSTVRDGYDSVFLGVNFSAGQDCFQGYSRYFIISRARAVRTITE